jgi:hypothetical protein
MQGSAEDSQTFRLNQGSGPVPCPGIAVWFPSRCAGTSPLDELTLGPLPSLRSDPVPPARSSPRSPAMPEAGPLGIPETANPEVIAAARTPRQSLRLVSRRSQSRRCSVHPVACAALVARRGSGSACAKGPTVIPPRRPHPQVRGTCGGIFQRWAR